MKRLVSRLIGLTFLVCVFQACTAEHGKEVQASSLGLESVAIFETTLYPVLVTNCGSCHGVNQMPLHALPEVQAAHDNIFSMGLVNLKAPETSRLVAKVQGSHVGIASSVADQIQGGIADWNAQLEALGVGGPGLDPVAPTGDVSVDLFATTVFPVLRTNCASCHGANQPPLHSVNDVTMSHDLVVQTNLVDLVDPFNSRLATKIQGGHEGISTAVGDELATQINLWVMGGGGAGVEPILLEPTFSSINALILQPKCATCHNPNGIRPSEDYSNYQTTITTGKISGDFWSEIVGNDMPIDSNENPLPLSDLEKAAIRTWLDEGALNN